MNLSEDRAFEFEAAEIRAHGAGERQRFEFRGYAATFGTLSKPIPARFAPPERAGALAGARTFLERIAPGAFDRTLAEDPIRLVLNHEFGAVLGTTRAGTLRLSTDSRGLEVNADLPNTSYARDYAELVQRGDVGDMSFRFAPGAVDSWAPEDGAAVRTLESVRLREVSALTVPAAYPETSAAVELALARALAEAEDELRAGRVLSEENLAALRTALAHIQGIIERAGASSSSSRSADPRRLRLELLERLSA